MVLVVRRSDGRSRFCIATAIYSYLAVVAGGGPSAGSNGGGRDENSGKKIWRRKCCDNGGKSVVTWHVASALSRGT